MKKLVIGFLSVLFLVASVLSASPRKPRPSPRPGRAGGPTMWI